MRNPSSTWNGGFIRPWPRRVIRALLGVCLLLLATLSILYFRQHSMVYHPRPYDESYAYAFPANGVEINYTVAAAKYYAYYIPATAPLPKRLWIAFCGNGSLALDFATHHSVQKVVLISPFKPCARKQPGFWVAGSQDC